MKVEERNKSTHKTSAIPHAPTVVASSFPLPSSRTTPPSDTHLPASPSGYEQDFYAWTQQQARLIATRQLSDLDYDNLIEEIEDLGKSEKREIVSRMVILCSHLIKWIYQPDHRSSSWRGSIALARREIARLLRENPSLKRYPNEVFTDVYSDARFKAMAETNLEEATFCPSAPFTLEEALDDGFWPD